MESQKLGSAKGSRYLKYLVFWNIYCRYEARKDLNDIVSPNFTVHHIIKYTAVIRCTQ